jgi:hypothetical protein
MSNYSNVKEVLIRSREEILRELSRAGENGGTGLAQRYAPILVSLQGAIDVIDRMDDQTLVPVKKAEDKEAFVKKMAAAKAAKKTAVAV